MCKFAQLYACHELFLKYKMKETYFNEKLEKVSFRRRKDSLLYSRLYSFNVYFIYHTHLYVLGARVAQ